MTAADDAYTAAQALIAKAKAEGATKVHLNTAETRALTRLPPEIADFAGLPTLNLRNTQITDLSPLAALTGLSWLYLDNTQIADFSPLTALTGLSRLSLNNTQIADLSPLTPLTGLSTLYLNNTQIADLTPLATLTGLSMLSLNKTQIADLSPLTPLTGLSTLYLDNTQIADLSPLTTLTGLITLSLDNTRIADLRPLRALTALAKSPGPIGLTFQNTPATRTDPRLAEIAEIKGNATRARELFAYLETWVPPWEVAAPPEPDPLFKTVLTDGQLELAPDPPTQAERDEALKRALHTRLQSAAPNLARAAGNLFPRLASKARVLESLIDRPFDQLSFVDIHIEAEILQDRLERGTEDGVAFPEDVLGPLSDITRITPGLTLGHPTVDLLVQRVRDARSTPAPAEDEAKHAALSDAIVNDPAANGPNSRAMEDRIAALEDRAQRQAGWVAKHKWLVWTIGVTGTLSSGMASGILANNLGPAITDFIIANAALLWEVALTYGPGFAQWFGFVMGPAFLALGVSQEVVKRMSKPK